MTALPHQTSMDTDESSPVGVTTQRSGGRSATPPDAEESGSGSHEVDQMDVDENSYWQSVDHRRKEAIGKSSQETKGVSLEVGCESGPGEETMDEGKLQGDEGRSETESVELPATKAIGKRRSTRLYVHHKDNLPRPQLKTSQATSEQSRKRPRSKAKSKEEVEIEEERDSLPGGESADNPIDVDLYASLWQPVGLKEFVRAIIFSCQRYILTSFVKVEGDEITFKMGKIPRKMPSEKPMRAFDAEGNQVTFTPCFHVCPPLYTTLMAYMLILQHNVYNTRVTQFFERIEAGYVDGKPLHIVAMERSAFEIVQYENFQKMAHRELQDLLRRKIVVLTEVPHDSTMAFDERGLRTLSPLKSRVSIQGMCYAGNSHNFYPPIKCAFRLFCPANEGTPLHSNCYKGPRQRYPSKC